MIAAVNTSGAESITKGRAHAEGANLLDRAINDDSETAFTEMAFDVGRAGLEPAINGLPERCSQ